MEDLAPALRISSCSLFAPAASVALFESHYYSYLVSPDTVFGLDRMQVFNLDDRLERDDTVGEVYRKSLLYLVANAFEEAVPAAILGLQKDMDDLLNKDKMAAVRDRFSVRVADGSVSDWTESTTHGGFDNDVKSMNSLLRTILGAGVEPKRLFTQSSLDY